VELLRTTLHKYQDGKRLDAFAEEKDVLAQIQAQERHLLPAAMNYRRSI